MSAGTVIFLTGPPASGKTSTSFLWSLQRSRPTWPLEWDATAGVLRAGSELGLRCLPAGMNERYQLAADVMAHQAKAITEAGNDCIVLGAWALDWPGPNPWAAMVPLDPIICVLLPDVETSVLRNAPILTARGATPCPRGTCGDRTPRTGNSGSNAPGR